MELNRLIDYLHIAGNYQQIGRHEEARVLFEETVEGVSFSDLPSEAREEWVVQKGFLGMNLNSEETEFAIEKRIIPPKE